MNFTRLPEGMDCIDQSDALRETLFCVPKKGRDLSGRNDKTNDICQSKEEQQIAVYSVNIPPSSYYSSPR
jgi:hypothetical protein